MVANNELNIQLTYVDKIILNSYKSTLDGLATYLGSAYEIVLHSLEDHDHSAIKVINGFHTNRKEGAPITNVALRMLEKIKKNETKDMDVTYFTKNKKGEPLKATTTAILGENDRIIGLLCINFNLNTSLASVIEDISQDTLYSLEAGTPNKGTEIFSSDSKELIIEVVEEVHAEVKADETINPSNENKEIIYRLKEKGIFNLKNAVNITANTLDISKNTVYLHLRNSD